jgi:predicted membrane channel-forming protein YqfA (hemolysin III family)
MPDRTTHLIGWILFVLSAIGFIVSSARLGDVAGIAGGVLFLAGCLVFIVPLLGK